MASWCRKCHGFHRGGCPFDIAAAFLVGVILLALLAMAMRG